VVFVNGPRQSELLKQLASSDESAGLYHFRTSDGKEVDFVLECPNGSISGIEVKARDSVTEVDFHGLKELHRQTGYDFMCWITLYLGRKIFLFERRLRAVPVDSRWV